jgi:hypothetical protein
MPPSENTFFFQWAAVRDGCVTIVDHTADVDVLYGFIGLLLCDFSVLLLAMAVSLLWIMLLM